ncbi:MAG: hypothetical protein EPO39_01800 [Candidatus Manganitrophaceae bacterium]|nr:MAG: hypothetical protein EPO39_01800 [Candidatus Manganitrophaceae bacterium]
MNSFLHRVLAPGLRTVGRFEPPRKGEAVKMEPLLEEIVEERSDAPALHPPSDPARGEAPLREGRSDEARPAISSADRAEGPSFNEPSLEPAPAPRRPVEREDDPLFEAASAVPRSDRPRPPEAAFIAAERSKPAAEIRSFETITFDPAAPGSLMRPFQRAGQAAGENPPISPAGKSAREIVWEVVSAGPPSQGDSPFPHQREARLEESSPSEAPSQKEPVNPGVSDPMQPFLSGNLSPQRERKEEARPGPIPKRPAGSIPPRPDAAPKEEKGDLIIEQLEVRVVAEPARKPEPPKGRRTAPKRSGAWETAARYYLGKV